MKEKPCVVRYVRLVKKLFIAVSCIFLPAIMVCLVFAFSGAMAFWIITPALLVAYLVLYGFYAMRVSMGTAVGIEVTGEVVHVKTPRKTFTYDVKRGCVAVSVKSNRYVCTFQTIDSRDSFLFYRRPPFSKPYEQAFTDEEIASFYPAFDDIA